MLLLAFAGNAIQLVPDGTLLLHLVIIIMMVAMLNATLLKPINRILEERERRTTGRLTEAQQAMAKVEQKLGEFESRLREARAEGYALMEKERLLLSQQRERQVADVRTEVGGLLQREKEVLSAEVERVKQTLQSDAKNLALEISRQILRRPIANADTN